VIEEELTTQHMSESKRAEAEIINARKKLEWRIKRFQEDNGFPYTTNETNFALYQVNVILQAHFQKNCKQVQKLCMIKALKKLENMPVHNQFG
jgi:hypothetical protein